MVRATTAKETEAELLFAREAAADFATHKEHSTYGDIGVGAFLAIRWGLGDNSVLVLKLDATHEGTNYQNLVRDY